MAQQVGGDDGEGTGELGQDWEPGFVVHPDAVQKKQGGALTRHDEGTVVAVDPDFAYPERPHIVSTVVTHGYLRCHSSIERREGRWSLRHP